MKLSKRLWTFVLLTIVTVLANSSANGELFKSLKFGISFEYPSDLKPFVSDSIRLDGPENVHVYILVNPSKSISTVDDLVSQTEKNYQDIDPKLAIQGTSERKISDVSAIEKVYLLNNNHGQNFKIRNLYFKNGDLVYSIECVAPDYFYDRASSDFFDPLIDSLTLSAVDKSIEKNIAGFPKYTNMPILSSPLIADIDKDGSQEIVVGSNDKNLYAWRKDGSIVRGFPVEAKGAIESSPAFGDVNGDGRSEIIVGSSDGKIYAINSNGSIISGFPKATEGGILSSPALGDVNNDKSLEIFAGSMDLGLYAWDKDGSQVCGFPVITGIGSGFNLGINDCTGLWSSPAIGDLNGDGKKEIVVGSNKINLQYMIQGNALINNPTNSGRIIAVSGKGKEVTGFPAELDLGTLITYSSPVLADLNGDRSLEIIFGSVDGLYCLDAKGESVKGFPIKTDGSLAGSFIAVGDLEGNGKLEIVAGGRDGRLYVWNSDGSDYPGFPIQTGGFIRHVTLGDIDKDGKQEILGGSSDNCIHAWKLDGSEVPGFPKITLAGVESAPTMSDLKGDGSLELAAGTDDGTFYVWEISKSYGKLQWPMFRQNPQHTGVYSSS
jgi:WD40 repeat protein